MSAADAGKGPGAACNTLSSSSSHLSHTHSAYRHSPGAVEGLISFLRCTRMAGMT